LTGDEEVGSLRGTIPLLERGLITGRWAICGEPTALDVYLGNRGLVWLEIAVRGRGGHAGLSHALANPVPVAARLVTALHELTFSTVDERFDPSVPSLNVTRLDAGAAMNAVNVIPDTVTLGIDRRLLPGEDPDDAIAAIKAVVDDVVTAPYTAEVVPLRRWPPYAIAAGELIAVAAREAVRRVGRPGRFGMDSAANDSSWLDRAGIPTVLLGPGAPEAAHTTGESVAVEEIRDAVEIYARTAVALAAKEQA
jgi:acetylornithine deacetylase/succinyl-diaminopimelate desuccinylase-like protein